MIRVLRAPVLIRGGVCFGERVCGIFSFGDAPFYDSMGGTALNKPIVGVANN
jgi:hypothetical protein